MRRKSQYTSDAPSQSTSSVTDDPVFANVLNENSQTVRRAVIKHIEDPVGGRVVCYLENSEHPFSYIDNDDVVQFEDMLRSVSNSKKGFLILNSSRGNSNAAEKLLPRCRERFKDGLVIIVPNFAKGAAAMMCLGADKIMMGCLAELGPVDPQVMLPGDPPVPARSLVDGLEMIRAGIESGDPRHDLPMLQKVRPETIPACVSAIAKAECFARDRLSRYMSRSDPEHAARVAGWLSDGRTYGSHGKVIGYREAKDTLRLNVERMDPDSRLWGLVWELYVRSVVFMKNRGPGTAKMFESSDVSSTMDVQPPAHR